MTTPFAQLSRASQRIAIAKDVIAQIKAKVYEASQGTYLIFEDYEDYSCQLQTELKKKKVVCSVCGIGSIFVSSIKFKNHLTVGQASAYNDGDMMASKLRGIFPKSQLKLIEIAFEGELTGLSGGIDYDEKGLYEKAIDFGWQYEEDNDRLVAIMKNIIKNNGTFKP